MHSSLAYNVAGGTIRARGNSGSSAAGQFTSKETQNVSAQST
jgi:hypothetical protein